MSGEDNFDKAHKKCKSYNSNLLRFDEIPELIDQGAIRRVFSYSFKNLANSS